MIFRSIRAVFAGLVSIFAITTAIDMALHAAGVFPPMGEYTSSGPLALAAAYRLMISTGGCYLAARLAPNRPMLHALVLGGIGLALSIVGAVVFWGMGPAWYPLAVIAMAPLCAWAGGQLHEGQARRGVVSLPAAR
jgi:hypothetical protein